MENFAVVFTMHNQKTAVVLCCYTSHASPKHFDNGRKHTTCKSACPVSFRYTGQSRLCGEPREVSYDSFLSDGIPRFPSAFNNYMYDSNVTPRKSSQDTVGVPKGPNSVFPDIAKVDKPGRLAKLFHSSCLSSSSS